MIKLRIGLLVGIFPPMSGSVFMFPESYVFRVLCSPDQYPINMTQSEETFQGVLCSQHVFSPRSNVQCVFAWVNVLKSPTFS